MLAEVIKSSELLAPSVTQEDLMLKTVWAHKLDRHNSKWQIPELLQSIWEVHATVVYELGKSWVILDPVWTHTLFPLLVLRTDFEPLAIFVLNPRSNAHTEARQPDTAGLKKWSLSQKNLLHWSLQGSCMCSAPKWQFEKYYILNLWCEGQQAIWTYMQTDCIQLVCHFLSSWQLRRVKTNKQSCLCSLPKAAKDSPVYPYTCCPRKSHKLWGKCRFVSTKVDRTTKAKMIIPDVSELVIKAKAISRLIMWSKLLAKKNVIELFHKFSAM